MTDKDLISNTTNQKGRATGLNILEDLVIAADKEKIRKVSETISYPLID